ncbi:FYVE, RhoGEF and PH domain-containing protein 2 isoform X11 [Phocoena sinus]|uniref:FYVE, RhoGEF and PH domain-containing protein 2 isoform X11 n=1 Tax=Phocoena sinus TaxID=42100 RepID=UPI0013C451AF|nr:FYVE, RhoGEF and PH domain-containing protein 2 isoform X11 [Phocoena sinus]
MVCHGEHSTHPSVRKDEMPGWCSALSSSSWWRKAGNPQVCCLLLRTPGAAPRVHGLEAGHHHPGCRPPSPTGPWDKPTVEEAVDSGPRTVSRRYLSSLKNKLSSRDWRKSCQARTCPGPGTQEPEEKRIVQELLETEQAYVARLYLLDQVFFQELLKEARSSKAFPEDVVRLIFSNTASIYQFHAQFFLPELQQRLDDWTTTPRIGDVIQKLAPFLKMYSEYVKNFERAAELLATWSDKSPPFQEVITRIQERLQELWEVYQRLGLEDDLVDPSNTLLREGPVLKISFRRVGPMERYLFLFNNMLLYCVPRVIQVGAQFQVRTRIDVASMKVRELTDAEFPHSFLVSGKQRTLELRARRSQEEMISWLQACQAAIDQIEKRNETFKAAVQSPEGDTQEQELQSEELGLRAPQWVRDKMVTMCMRCQEPFNALMRRRHHCRACGYVVCARCSDYRAELKYDDNRPSRVCLDCYTFLTGNVLPEDKEDKRRGILEKGAAAGSEQSLMCSFLQLLGDKWGKSGSRGWCVILRDDPLVLYVYAAPQPSEAVAPNGRTAAHSSALPSQDMRAHTSIPLLGYQVTAGPQADPRVFQLQQSGQLYTFKAETEELKDRWVKAMERAASGLSPGGPNDRDLSD